MRHGPEAEFQAAVVQLARLRRWRVAHFRPATLTNGKTITPVAADGAGFPDLVLAKPRVGVVFAELKARRGRLSPAQTQWVECLRSAGAECHVWTPDDWDVIERVLAGR
jgi:hypothetical protein